jgi:hypothetical protein
LRWCATAGSRRGHGTFAGAFLRHANELRRGISESEGIFFKPGRFRLLAFVLLAAAIVKTFLMKPAVTLASAVFVSRKIYVNLN